MAYFVICGSLIAVGLYFFYGGFWNVNRASMGRMFEGLVCLPVALNGLVIPLVTMRAMADEKRSGTLELLITMPVKDSEVILGKYFAALGMTCLLLVISLALPDRDVRLAMAPRAARLGARLGRLLRAGALLGGGDGAVGLMYSSLTESQIIAFFLTFGSLILSALYVVGSLVEYVPGGVGDVISFISFQSRFASFARGLIDTRAIVYFLSIAVLCLLVSFRSLESRKWS